MLAGNTISVARPVAASHRDYPGRNGAVDIARFAGALGIVWFHEHAPFAWLGYAALPMFMAFLLYFALLSGENRAAGTNTRSRAARLLVPWLAWSAIYAVAKIADAIVSGTPLSSEFRSWMLLTGPSIHLWFLPFAFVIAWVLAFITRNGREMLNGWHIWGLFLLAQVGCYLLLTNYSFGRPFQQWLFVLPACFLGLMLYMAMGDRTRLLLVWVTTAIAYFLAHALGWEHGALQMLIAAALCVLALSVHMPAAPLTKLLADVSLGIYLVHPMIHAILYRIADVELRTVDFAATVVMVSVAVVAIMKQIPYLRRIV